MQMNRMFLCEICYSFFDT